MDEINRIDIIKTPLAIARAPLRIGAVHLFVRLSVCRQNAYKNANRVISTAYVVTIQKNYRLTVFLSASLYFSKRGAYRDRLCRDVVGRWLVVTRVHCGETVHPRPIVTMEH